MLELIIEYFPEIGASLFLIAAVGGGWWYMNRQLGNVQEIINGRR